jgi:hypothetical protein
MIKKINPKVNLSMLLKIKIKQLITKNLKAKEWSF